jgi:hypothetical protein
VSAAEYDFSGVSPIVERFIHERRINGAGLIVVDRDDGIVDEEYWGEFGPDRVSLMIDHDLRPQHGAGGAAFADGTEV